MPYKVMFFFIWCNSPQWARASLFTMFLDHTQLRTTVGRTPLDEGSAHRRDLYVTKHDAHNKHPCPRCDSNPKSRQMSGRRRTPQTARPLGPVTHATGMYSYPSKISPRLQITNFEYVSSGHTMFTWARMWWSVVIFRSQKASTGKGLWNSGINSSWRVIFLMFCIVSTTTKYRHAWHKHQRNICII
jgi:hypothetical protein